MNLLRTKIQNIEKIKGTVVSLTDPCICEIIGNAGYDCVWIDTEHTYMSYKDVLCHLNASRSANIPAIVRLPQNDLTATKKILEMGPDGIIFPMVTSPDEVKNLISMTLYPPLGTRGFGPMRAIGYGTLDATEYAHKYSLEMCRFVQLEHIDAINALEEIAQIPYIDGFIFGPNDLSGSLGDFLNVYGDKTISEIKRAIRILKKYNKYIGLAGGMNESHIKIWSELELDMLFSGADWCFIFNQAKNTLKTMNKYF